jgi:hypothetical protein
MGSQRRGPCYILFKAIRPGRKKENIGFPEYHKVSLPVLDSTDTDMPNSKRLIHHSRRVGRIDVAERLLVSAGIISSERRKSWSAPTGVSDLNLRSLYV